MLAFGNDEVTGRDLSRQDATSLDTDFILSLEEVAERYARAGHARTLRSLQRYCATGHLDARKIATAIGDKYLVTPQSVARHIAEIIELSEMNSVATGRDMSRHVAADTGSDAKEFSPATPPSSPSEEQVLPVMPHVLATVTEPSSVIPPSTPASETATEPDNPRPVATEQLTTGESSRYVAHLEQQLEVARDERDFLREQIDRKDKTIDALLERDKETNYLVRGLQEMLTPLLGGRRREEPPQVHTQ